MLFHFVATWIHFFYAMVSVTADLVRQGTKGRPTSHAGAWNISWWGRNDTWLSWSPFGILHGGSTITGPPFKYLSDLMLVVFGRGIID